jgi:predicted RNase H-like nuclease (RuvC/YqgF family)
LILAFDEVKAYLDLVVAEAPSARPFRPIDQEIEELEKTIAEKERELAELKEKLQELKRLKSVSGRVASLVDSKAEVKT